MARMLVVLGPNRLRWVSCRSILHVRSRDYDCSLNNMTGRKLQTIRWLRKRSVSHFFSTLFLPVLVKFTLPFIDGHVGQWSRIFLSRMASAYENGGSFVIRGYEDGIYIRIRLRIPERRLEATFHLYTDSPFRYPSQYCPAI